MDYKNNNSKIPKGEEGNALPPNLDWDNMRTGIYEKMETLAPEYSKKKNFFYSKRFIALLGLLLLFVASGLWNLTMNRTEQLTTPHDNVQNTSSKPNESSIKATNAIKANTSMDLNDNLYLKSEQAGLMEGNRKQPFTNNTVNVNRLTTSEYKQYFSNQNESKNQEIGIGELINLKENLNLEKKAKTIVSNNTKTVEDAGMNKTAKVGEEEITDFSALETLVIPIPVPISHKEMHTIDPILNNKISKKARLQVLSGLGFWSENQVRDTIENKDYTSTLNSFNAQFNYIHPLKNDFTLLVGLHYQRLRSRLDYTKAIEGYQVTLKDTIINIQHNVLTGAVTNIYGDVTLEVPAERIVRHYNTTELLQIPILLGKTWRKGKWQSDLMAGAALNILSRNKGKLLDNGEFVTYNASASPKAEQQFKIGALLSGQLSYAWNENISVSSGVQLQQSLSDWSTKTSVTSKPFIANLTLGLTYSFQ